MTRSRVKLDQEKPKWLGKYRQCTKTNPITHTLYSYEGFQFNDVTAYVGDFVLVCNIDADEPDTMDGCDVARIEHLFESPRHQNDRFRANVQWFSKPSKLPNVIDTDHMDHRYEIVEDWRKFDSNVSIESIYKRCIVVNTYEDEIPEEVYSRNKLDVTSVYVCRYRLFYLRHKFVIEPVLKLEGMLLSNDDSNSGSGIGVTEKNALNFVPNSIIVETETKQKGTNPSTPKSQSISSKNESKKKLHARLRTALRKCSIDSDSESSNTMPTSSAPIVDNQDSDFENTPKSTPRKNPPRSSKKNKTPLKSNHINTSGLDASYRSGEKNPRQSISRNLKSKIKNDDVVESTPTKTQINRSTRKRRATRSSSEESLEPRSRSVSPEIDCIGPPAAYKLYETKGRTFVIKKPISIDKKVSKKLCEADISGLLSSEESDDDALFDKLEQSGTKIVARSKSDKTGFELLNTPSKAVRLLGSISEDGEAETPKSAKRNLSETLEIEESRDARKDLLLKKLADKREDASLRIKLRRSSEQSIYKIDSDSDNGKSSKPRRRTVINTPKSIMKVDSKAPTTPSVKFSNQDEINEYSPINDLSKKLLKVELKRVENNAVRKSPRNKTANTRYSDYYEIVNTPMSLSKRVRKTDHQEDNDDDGGSVPNEKRSTRQTRHSINSAADDMECSDSKVDESEKKNHRTRTPRKTRCSKNSSVNETNGIFADELKTPTKVSEIKQRESSRYNKNDFEDVDLTKTPKSSRKIVNTDNLTTPSRRTKKIEYEECEPITPKRIPVTPKTKTPSRAVKNGLLTPSMKQRNLCVAKPSTPLQEARARLHVSAVPKSLPCREEEFNNIYTFLEGKLTENSGGCLYISGVPGTGKTATVNEVIRCLKKSVSKKKLEDFEFLQINGMKLTEPRQAYVEILKQLTGKKATWEQAQQLLDKRFTRAAPRSIMTLLLVDELDILCNKRQDVVYNLLDWPAKSFAHLVVITIANTMDLPERVLMGRVTSRLGLTRLTFQPYTHKQLQEIVTARLNDSHAFKSEAIQLVARKVAAVSGDARRALDICRRATEVAEVNNSEIVSMQDVNEALTEMIASAKVQAIRHCSEMERTFLQAVCAEVARTGVEEVTFNNIYVQLTSLCSLEGLNTPSVTEALTICAELGAYRLLICEHSRADIQQRVLLNISPDDVHFSMQNIEV